MACQQGTLTLLDTWFRPVLGLACDPIVETSFFFCKLAMIFSTFFQLEHPSVLSRIFFSGYRVTKRSCGWRSHLTRYESNTVLKWYIQLKTSFISHIRHKSHNIRSNTVDMAETRTQLLQGTSVTITVMWPSPFNVFRFPSKHTYSEAAG